jgi:hypothetical protein
MRANKCKRPDEAATRQKLCKVEVDQQSVIPFHAAVAELKKIGARIKDVEGDLTCFHLRLGEVADKVETKYQDRTLAKLADASGIAKSTLYHDRTVYRAWKGILPPGAKLPAVSVLKELAGIDERAELIAAEPDMSKRRAEVHRALKEHPKRDEIRRKHPQLTCTRQARDIMDSYDKAKSAGNGKGRNGNSSKRWFVALVKRCTEDMDETAIADQPMTVEQLRDLREGIEPALLATLKDCGEMWLRLHSLLAKLCSEGPQAVAAERERRAKENAADADLAEQRKRQREPTAPSAAMDACHQEAIGAA